MGRGGSDGRTGRGPSIARTSPATSGKYRGLDTVVPSTVNGTDLGAQEWHNALFLRYGLEPPDLPKYCDGCQAKFSISHALECRKSGIVTACHNEICDKVADLAVKAFTPSHVHDKPLTYPGRAVKTTKATPAGSNGNSENPAAPEIT